LRGNVHTSYRDTKVTTDAGFRQPLSVPCPTVSAAPQRHRGGNDEVIGRSLRGTGSELQDPDERDGGQPSGTRATRGSRNGGRAVDPRGVDRLLEVGNEFLGSRQAFARFRERVFRPPRLAAGDHGPDRVLGADRAAGREGGKECVGAPAERFVGPDGGGGECGEHAAGGASAPRRRAPAGAPGEAASAWGRRREARPAMPLGTPAGAADRAIRSARTAVAALVTSSTRSCGGGASGPVVRASSSSRTES